MAILIWIAIYPTINVLFWLLGDVLAPLPNFLKTLILTLILVPTMVFILIPILTKLFHEWLFPKAKQEVE